MATLTSEEVALAAVEDNPEGSKTGRGHLGQQVHVQVGKALEDEGGRDVPCRVEGRVAGQVASCEAERHRQHERVKANSSSGALRKLARQPTRTRASCKLALLPNQSLLLRAGPGAQQLEWTC